MWNKKIKFGFLRLLVVLLLMSCSSSSLSKSFRETTSEVNHEGVYDRPYVLLISIDGYRSDYTDLYKPKNIKKFRDEGASTQGLLPVFPSKTFTNHYSIITGLYAENHGIVANHFYDPERDETYSLSNRKNVEDASWYKGTPIWVAAQKQGMLAASFFWPGSEAAIQGVRPAYYYHYDNSIPHDNRIEQAFRWFQLPPEKRPHFMTLYFSEVDTAGHHFGPHSKELKVALKKVDHTLGKLFESLKKLPFPVYTMIVSDHGMQELDSSKIIYLDDLISLEGLKVYSDGPQCLIYSKDKKKLLEIEKTLKMKPYPFHVYRKEHVPRSFRYSKQCPRCSDLVITVHAPYSLLLKKSKAKKLKGNHGFDGDTTPSMQGIFYAQGPSIKKEIVIKPFRNVHIYPLILHILGLKTLTPIDGDLGTLEGILEK